MLRLSDQHKEQIRSMLKDGKSFKDIADFMKATYGIEIKYHHVSYVKKEMAGSGEVVGKVKRAYKKRSCVYSPADKDVLEIDENTLTDDQLIRDIFKRIQDSAGLYRMVFLRLRRELIKTQHALYVLKKEFAEIREAEKDMGGV